MTAAKPKPGASAIDPSTLFEALRAEVIESLGYDASALRPWQTARVHALSLLHLEMDRMTTVALRGEAIDPRAVSVVAEQMEKLLHPSFGGDSPEARDREDEQVNIELTKMIDGIFLQREREAAEAMQNEELAAIAAALPVSAAPVAGEGLSTSENLPESPPANNTHVSYVDAEVLAPEPTEVVPAVKYASLNNPNSVPTPRSPKPLSPYDRQFEDHSTSGGIRRNWSPPFGW